MSALLRRLSGWFRRPLGWIVLGTTLRILHILTLGNRYYFGDTAEYQAAALRILHGISIAEASPRAPLYPLFMAGSFWIGGETNFILTRWLHLAIAISLMVVASRLALRLGGPTAATLTAAGLALAPTIVFVAGLLYPTTLYMLLLTSLVLLAHRIAERPQLRDGALLGLVLALGLFTDQVFLAPALGVALWLVSRLPMHRAALARVLALSVLTTAVVALPYTLAVRAASHDTVFMRKAQTVLHSARTDPVLSRDRWLKFPEDSPFEALSPQQFLLREGRLFATHPVAYTHDYVWEFLHFFRPIPDRVQTENRFTNPIVLYAGGIYFIALILLALLGLGFGSPPLRDRLLLAGVVLATAGFYAFFFTQARYRIPTEPLLIVLAALGVVRMFPEFARHFSDSARPTPPSA